MSHLLKSFYSNIPGDIIHLGREANFADLKSFKNSLTLTEISPLELLFTDIVLSLAGIFLGSLSHTHMSVESHPDPSSQQVC